MLKTNPYDELSDGEEAILKMAELGLTNHVMAARLNVSYGTLGMMKVKMRKKGIYVPNSTLKGGLTDDIREKIRQMDRDAVRNYEMARQLGVKHSTLCFWKNTMRAEGVEFQARSGRPSLGKKNLLVSKVKGKRKYVRKDPESPRFSVPRGSNAKRKVRYLNKHIATWNKQNRKAQNDRNNALFREARKKMKGESKKGV